MHFLSFISEGPLGKDQNGTMCKNALIARSSGVRASFSHFPLESL